MSSRPAISLPSGLLREPVLAQTLHPRQLTLFAAVNLALLVPYISHMVPALYQQGLFPVRPVFFMSALGLANLALCLRMGIDLPKASLLLLALLSARIGDAAGFQRFLFPEGQEAAVLSLGASLFAATVYLSILGVLYRVSLQPVLWIAALSVLAVAGSIFLEMRGVFAFSTVEGRAAGFPGDANDAAMNINLMLGVFLSINRRFWLNIGLIAVSGAAILPTLSRGGFLVFALILIAFTALDLRRHFRQFITAALLAVPVFLLGVRALFAANMGNGRVDDNGRKRLEGIFGGDLDAMQSGERLKDLTDGLGAIAQKPLFGHGTGAGSLLYQPHNQIVSLWIDNGLLAVLLYTAILILLAWKTVQSRFRTLCILIPLVFYVPLAQTLLDNHAYLFAVHALFILTAGRVLSFRLSRPALQPSLTP